MWRTLHAHVLYPPYVLCENVYAPCFAIVSNGLKRSDGPINSGHVLSLG